MYIIIAGCRKVGSNLALDLSQDNHDVVVIDNDPNNFDALGSGFNGVTLAGMPIDEDVLRSAGIEQADVLAAVTNDDNMNVMVSQVARELFHVPMVITRVYDPERETVMNRMGLKTICPTTLAVQKIKNLILPGNLPESVNIHGAEISFRLIKPGKRLTGRNVADIEENVLGIIKKGKFSLANPQQVIEPEDMLIVAQSSDGGG